MAQNIELEIIKQKLIGTSDNASSFVINEENLFSIDLVEIIFKASPYKTPLELIQALNKDDVVLNINLSTLETPRWSPKRETSVEYDADGNQITSASSAAKGKVDTSNWDVILSSLQKSAELEEADSGHWYLKIGFPILRGYWKERESYTVFNAPLFFAPAKISYTSIDDVTITIKGKQFDINPSIATLTSIRKKMLFDTMLFGVTDEIDIEKITKGYANIGITFDLSPLNQNFDRCEFSNKQNLLKSFQAKNAPCFILPSITIGLYDIYSNAIFWDFNKILQTDSDGLATLLEPKTNLMFNYKKFTDDFRTNDVYLFSMIDIVQQLCVGRALSGNTLIQGPPGTGKSETICNILVNIALNNKTALVVSSKKTALDVLINRLGDYSPIACHMVTKRKEAEYFYQQFDKLYKRFIAIRSNMEDETVDEVINRTTSEKLFEDIYTDYTIINKLYNTKILFQNKEYKVSQLIAFADISDVAELERNNLKSRNQVLEYIEKNITNATGGSKLEKITNIASEIISDFSKYSTLLNPYLEVNIGYIEALADYLRYYDGYDKRLIIASYIIDNQGLEFEEFDKLMGILGQQEPDMTDLTTKQIGWIEAVRNHDLASFLNIIETARDRMSSTTIERFDISQELRLFSSWYIFINPEIKSYFKEFSRKENKIEDKTEIYLDRVQESIYETKQLLNRLIFIKFIDTIKKFGNEFSTIMRQRTAYNPRPSAAIIKSNYELFRNLYPIHVVSVDDVSNLIPCEAGIYDYYVCDEASQIELEKALPSMYRGKKYVISGDTKQLQPTSVFKKQVEIKTSVAQDSKYAQDLNDAIKAASIMQYYESRASTNVMLNYHYRSTYAELIDFSNQVFYDRNLKLVSKCVPYESPIIVHRINGIWKNSSNIEECNAIYQRVLELSNSSDYNKTLGIITFNATQQALINERLLKTSSPKVKEWMERKSSNGSHIGIFVQNIENVQGDERDIILFSIGYDRTVANYGSLSTQADGANRINVAITRARDRLELFQSEEAHQYRGSTSTAKGPKVLCSWIRWASNMAEACANKAIKNSATPKFISKIDKEIYEYIKSQLPAEYNIVYNQMQGTYFVNFAIFKNITPVAAIFSQRDNWKNHGSFREEYIYRKLFFRNREWLSFDLSSLSWQIQPNYKTVVSKFLEKVLTFDDKVEVLEDNNNIIVDIESVDENSQAVDVDFSAEASQEVVTETVASNEQSGGGGRRSMSRR